MKTTKESAGHYEIIDMLKGVCALWVIMLHAIPAGGIYKILLMPFCAQLTIPFFMILSGFTYALSFEKHGNWYSMPNLWRKAKRFVLPFIPALVLEIIVLGKPENMAVWLLSGGYQMPGSYYVILMIQLVVLFPAIYGCYHLLHGKRRLPWIVQLLLIFAFHCGYEIVTYLLDLDIRIYRLLIFRYFIFLYMGIVLCKMNRERAINWKSMMKMLPIGFLYIFFVGYLNWRPEILFRYPTWYRSAAPVIFWTAPIVACIFANSDRILKWFEKHKALQCISNTMKSIGKASYHIYIVQMLWFGIVISRFNTDTWRKLIVCVVSMVVCSVLGLLYYHICNGKQWARLPFHL